MVEQRGDALSPGGGGHEAPVVRAKGSCEGNVGPSKELRTGPLIELRTDLSGQKPTEGAVGQSRVLHGKRRMES